MLMLRHKDALKLNIFLKTQKNLKLFFNQFLINF